MTTTVTLKTHDWPVKVVISDSNDYTTHDGSQHVISHAVTTQTVEPNSEQSFYITDTRSISFNELPMPETGAA